MLETYQAFLDKFFVEFEKTGIDMNDLTLDHIAYQTASAKEYEAKKIELETNATLVHEATVHGRKVGIFVLNTPLKYKQYVITAIEILEPTEGEEVKSVWEHVEFVTNVDLITFKNKYPGLDWDLSSMDRAEFPRLKLKLKDMRVKFPSLPILEDIKQQKRSVS